MKRGGIEVIVDAHLLLALIGCPVGGERIWTLSPMSGGYWNPDRFIPRNQRMKPNTKQKQFVEKTLNSIRTFMNLDEWVVHIRFSDEDEGKADGVMAKCEPEWNYFEALITILPNFWRAPREEQIRVLLHEMSHIWTAPYKDIWDRMHHGENVSGESEALVNEQLTSRIAKTLWHLWKKS